MYRYLVTGLFVFSWVNNVPFFHEAHWRVNTFTCLNCCATRAWLWITKLCTTQHFFGGVGAVRGRFYTQFIEIGLNAVISKSKAVFTKANYWNATLKSETFFSSIKLCCQIWLLWFFFLSVNFWKIFFKPRLTYKDIFPLIFLLMFHQFW